ncbi:MAG: translocation/assembly module TamB domain-containing protein [Proteobacteria bacterium]|nr:translocation/assembly module TamB domain-containing protein [Pseudomonadota bacterium]
MSTRADTSVASKNKPCRRRWLWRGLIGIFIALLLTSATGAWLLLTASGRDAGLALFARLLPANALSWQRADGTLSGPLILYDLRWRHAGVDFRAQRVTLDPSLAALFARRLRLGTLDVDAATLDLPIDRTPQPPPRWPDVLPKFDVPIAIDIGTAHLHALRISREGAPVVAIARLRGGLLLAPGRLRIEHLTASTDHGRLVLDGRIDARRQYATRVQATWDAPASAHLRLVAGGDLDHFVMSLAGRAPEPVCVHLTLDNGRRVPDWTLALHAQRFDSQALLALASTEKSDATASSPWNLDLDTSGHGGAATLHGGVEHAGLRIGIAPSKLAYADGVLDASPLTLNLLDGRAQVSGRADFNAVAPRVDARVTLDGVRWRADAQASPVQARGDLKFAGAISEWTLSGALDLHRDGEKATVQIAGNGDATQASLQRFDATTSAGAMHASGHVAWAPHPAWRLDAKLDRFDPGYFAPGFEGRVSAHLQSDGANDPQAGLTLRAVLDGLSGTLRGRSLGGGGTLDWRAGKGQVDADLRVGGSRVQAKGTLGSSFDLVARFAPLQLDDLLPDARGRIEGQLGAQGEWPFPALAGKLAGSGLRWREYAVSGLSLDGRIGANGNEGALHMQADGIAGIGPVHALQLQWGGSTLRPRVSGHILTTLGNLELAASAQRERDAWSARIESLHVSPSHGPAWTLGDPANLRRDDNGGIRLASACLHAADASVCMDADWPRRAHLQAHGLPLSLLDPWIASPDFDARAYGNVDMDASIAPGARGGFNGSAQLRSDSGGLHVQSQAQRPLLGYTQLRADARLDGERVQTSVSAELSAGGSVQGELSSGISPASPMQGQLSLDLRDIGWLELFSTDIAAPKGRFGGTLTLAGSIAHPQISGSLRLTDFQTELPALGIALKDGHVSIDADDSGAATISGALRAGDGTLDLAGGLRWDDFSAPITLTARGNTLRIADTPELSAIASPDLHLGYAADTLTLRGSVAVPTAKLDLERLDGAVTPSPDVVVLDPAEKLRSSPIKVDVDLKLALGDDVQLKGFGLDGKLGGQLRVRKPPGAAPTAIGALDVSGRYSAYGQQLSIERGRLTYNGGGFDDPALDILAQREFDDDTTVGVRVRGTALRPQTQIVSTPAMEPSNALAYLVIGRPLQSANADESRQIGAASTALAVGSNLLAAQIGARLGLDAGVSQSRALGGEALTVGKYLSPRLFVSYGVALVGTGEVLTLKYLLRKGFDVSIESAKENRASINWRIEK